MDRAFRDYLNFLHLLHRVDSVGGLFINFPDFSKPSLSNAEIHVEGIQIYFLVRFFSFVIFGVRLDDIDSFSSGAFLKRVSKFFTTSDFVESIKIDVAG